MKAEILKLRAENKVLKTNYVKPDMKDNESNDSKENKCSKNIDCKTQKESTFTEKVTDDYRKSSQEKYKHINCKYFFFRGQGCKRKRYCWFSHEVETNMEGYCPYWWDGRCRYAADYCRSGKHGDFAINQ